MMKNLYEKVLSAPELKFKIIYKLEKCEKFLELMKAVVTGDMANLSKSRNTYTEGQDNPYSEVHLYIQEKLGNEKINFKLIGLNILTNKLQRKTCVGLSVVVVEKHNISDNSDNHLDLFKNVNSFHHNEYCIKNVVKELKKKICKIQLQNEQIISAINVGKDPHQLIEESSDFDRKFILDILKHLSAKY